MKKLTTIQAIKQQGFTLIEIMVVVVILGILAAIVIPKIISRPEQARIVQAKQNILSIQEALDLYKLDNGFYPSTDQSLRALILRPLSDPRPMNWKAGGYLRVPNDPWGRAYQYLNPGIHNPDSVDIFTYGPTGQPGGTGENATIGNWGSQSGAKQ
jgi:general secretion pathway protein G